MTALIATVGVGKGTWGTVRQLIDSAEWTSIFIIAQEFAAQKFSAGKKFEFILIKEEQSLPEMTEAIRKQLEGKIQDLEVALNMESGSGKEHMAAMAALMKLGVGIRQVTSEKDRLQEL